MKIHDICVCFKWKLDTLSKDNGNTQGAQAECLPSKVELVRWNLKIIWFLPSFLVFAFQLCFPLIVKRADQVIVLMRGDNRSKRLATIQSSSSLHWHPLRVKITFYPWLTSLIVYYWLLYLVWVISSLHIILWSSFSSVCWYRVFPYYLVEK